MMQIDIRDLKLRNNREIYTLKEIFSEEELYELRKEHPHDYVIVKIGNKLYTTFIHIKGGTNFESKNTICIGCEKFSYCPKVMDREFIVGTFTKNKYENLMRLEKYPFILFGVETYGRFFVWKCKSYKKEEHKEIPKKRDIEEIYPYLKILRLEKEEELKNRKT